MKIFKPSYPSSITNYVEIPIEAQRIRADSKCKMLKYENFDCPKCGKCLGERLPSSSPNVIVKFSLPWGAYFWWSVITCDCGEKLLISNSGV
jgi:hypothetical protein